MSALTRAWRFTRYRLSRAWAWLWQDPCANETYEEWERRQW